MLKIILYKAFQDVPPSVLLILLLGDARDEGSRREARSLEWQYSVLLQLSAQQMNGLCIRRAFA